jgi:hypothetical protein
MLVMFGVGVGNLAGMAALTGAMVIEKTVPGGKRLSPVIGIILLLLGVLWLAHPVWLQRAGILGGYLSRFITVFSHGLRARSYRSG